MSLLGPLGSGDACCRGWLEGKDVTGEELLWVAHVAPNCWWCDYLEEHWLAKNSVWCFAHRRAEFAHSVQGPPMGQMHEKPGQVGMVTGLC